MPWLTTEGASHQIAEGETIVGSGANTGWRLPRNDLAARHFIIERTGSRVTIRPCGVDAVIAVNGAQSGAQPRDLRDGDTIDAGTARFLYSSERSGSYPAISVAPAHLVETRERIAYDLSAPSVGIGRDRLTAIVVQDPTASRFHAEIRREAGGYVLHPHGSSGTWVNGRRLGSPERLNAGDRVEVANVEFQFVTGPIPADTKTADPSADDESEASHRPTVIQTAVMEIPSEPEQQARSAKWIWLAALIVAGATIYLATR